MYTMRYENSLVERLADPHYEQVPAIYQDGYLTSCTRRAGNFVCQELFGVYEGV